jgi:hypothetical protein
VAVGRQTDEQIDVFVVDRTGALNVSFVVGTGNWQGPFQIR